MTEPNVSGRMGNPRRRRVDNEPTQDTAPASEQEITLARLRQEAEEEGFTLAKRQAPRKARPEPKKGRVSTMLSIPVEVREAMETARIQLNMTFSQIAERAVVQFLDSQGIPVRGATFPDTPPPGQ